MPRQLLSFSLLNSSIRHFTPMRMEPAFHNCGGGRSIFTRVFPFRLRYAALLPKPPPCGCSSSRRFSGRAFQSRGDDRGRSSRDGEFSAGRGARRGEFQSGNLAGRAGPGKSLIEDEAELSDWVDDLKMDSMRFNLKSGDDDSDRGMERRGGRDGFTSSKRRRQTDFDDFRGDRNRRSSLRPSSFNNSRRRRHSDSADDDDYGGRRSSQRHQPSSFRNSERRSDSGSADDDGVDEGFLSRGRRQVGSVSSIRGRRDSGPRQLPRGDGRGVSLTQKRESERQRGPMREAIQMLESDDEDEDSDQEEDSDAFSALHDSKEDEDASTSPQLTRENNNQPSRRSSSPNSDSYLSNTRFDQCTLSPLSLKGIKDAGYERMTMVQEATLPLILKGKDVLAKAKTGTGKTVAFLLPAIEVLVTLPAPDRDNKRPPINVLVICPTRELANQAAKEANTLLKFHSAIGVQVVIGGVRLALEQKRMQTNPCQILVATPGRLRDHIENTPGFATRLMGVKVLVLDEADHLLDMGFRKDIEKIIAAVPKQRQTLLFSATVPEEVRQICHIALRRDYDFVNTVEEGSEETHSQVKQMHLVAPLDKHFPMLYGILKEHISEEAEYKVIVFCTTAMVTRLVAELISELNLNVREIHSRKSQSYRTKVSDEFRKSKSIILVTSDVSARGVDYPDVTLVVQIGLPSDREQYIHRLGRTGRKGKEGKGILLLAPWEDFFLSTIRDLPLTKAPSPSVDPDTTKKVQRALSHVEMKDKEAAYQAWLGYYNSQKNVGRDKIRLVELANDFSRTMGLDTPPAINKLVLSKMGLKNIPGLRAK